MEVEYLTMIVGARSCSPFSLYYLNILTSRTLLSKKTKWKLFVQLVSHMSHKQHALNVSFKMGCIPLYPPYGAKFLSC